MAFSDRLKQLRNRHKLSREQLAQTIGVSYSTISKYESGTREPDFKTLDKMSDYFDVTTDYLLGRSNTPSSQPESTNDSIAEINRLLDKYEIDDMAFFDIEKWKSMSPEQIRQLESYFQYLVEQSKKLNNDT
ncbi:helix-turn-helix transcriptional regulator [Halobacillus sp. BAB-2008]|uniref:helix-turn-helix domain-containing protein n=1 Tax=Halobacillus sp. BAB-2008 TaxID=1246484 RepID=UPI0002A4DFB3|nr:helix-turn-helix transcriptional regulator [Halobacillus sp. BAB-2008]ELK47218.1 SinR/xre family transcription regulator [Halobacillus sp. BAB-2008]